MRWARKARLAPLDGFEVANTKQIRGTELAKPTAGAVVAANGAAGFLVSHQENDAVTVINRVQKAGGDVYWLKSPITAGGKSVRFAGTYLDSPAPVHRMSRRSRPRTLACRSSAFRRVRVTRSRSR